MEHWCLEGFGFGPTIGPPLADDPRIGQHQTLHPRLHNAAR
jgi:hypothetical protein